MDENFVLTDDSDPDTPPQVYTAEELFANRDRLIGEFKPYNTAVTVKNEKIISILPEIYAIKNIKSLRGGEHLLSG